VIVVAFAHAEMVGFAEVSIRVDHVEGTTHVPVPYLEGWYVTPEYRRRGAGRALLAFIEQWARERGYGELASDAEIENETSIRLHTMLGFSEMGRTVHFVKPLPSG
jgi:aminoglycoside 6'-N-acetyltransferase I